MKIVIILFAWSLAGCAQMMQGATPDKPRVIDSAQKQLLTECNGYANGMNDCYQAAKRVCPNGYTVNEWLQNYGSVSRQIIFKCN